MHTGEGGGAGEYTAGAASPSNSSESNHDNSGAAVDVLFDGEQLHVLQAKRVRTQNTHGTGKTLFDPRHSCSRLCSEP